MSPGNVNLAAVKAAVARAGCTWPTTRDEVGPFLGCLAVKAVYTAAFADAVESALILVGLL